VSVLVGSTEKMGTGTNVQARATALHHVDVPWRPADLEQREGRVHRYKGHAVRKTIAERYRERLGAASGSDPWRALFDLASTDRDGNSDVIPFWVHGDAQGYRIERYVPVLPLSRDVLQFSRLRRSLVLYRIVFGQPRQDDLIAYLIERMPVESAREQLAAARIDLHPPQLPARARAALVPPISARVRTQPAGPLGAALTHALDRYSIVAGQDRANRAHPVAMSVKAIAGRLDRLDLAHSRGRCSWIAHFDEHRRWLDVPAIWLGDERKRVHDADDLFVEVLLDVDREGVHATLASEWAHKEGEVPLRTAHSYAEARRATLRTILDPLEREGFEPIPNREYLPIGHTDDAYGVVLAGRFYDRDDLGTDEPLVTGLARLFQAYDEAYELGLAHPTRGERASLS